MEQDLLDYYAKKGIRVSVVVAYQAFKELWDSGNTSPTFSQFLTKVLTIDRNQDQTSFQAPYQAQEDINLQRDWQRYKSSHTYHELAKALNVSYNTAMAYASLPIPPKNIVVPPNFIPTYVPKRAYRVSTQITAKKSTITRFEHGSKIEIGEKMAKALNISPTTRFYSDMPEEAKRNPELVLLRSFELALAARLQAFGLHDASVEPFPERLFLLESIYQNDRGTSYGNPTANKIISRLFPLYDSHGEKIYRCGSHKSGERPLATIELRMREFFNDDYEEIRTRLCLRHKDSPLTLFYCLGDIKTTQEASQILRDLAK